MSDTLKRMAENVRELGVTPKFLKAITDELLLGNKDVVPVPVREDLDGIRAMIRPHLRAA